MELVICKECYSRLLHDNAVEHAIAFIPANNCQLCGKNTEQEYVTFIHDDPTEVQNFDDSEIVSVAQSCGPRL